VYEPIVAPPAACEHSASVGAASVVLVVIWSTLQPRGRSGKVAGTNAVIQAELGPCFSLRQSSRARRPRLSPKEKWIGGWRAAAAPADPGAGPGDGQPGHAVVATEQHVGVKSRHDVPQGLAAAQAVDEDMMRRHFACDRMVRRSRARWRHCQSCSSENVASRMPECTAPNGCNSTAPRISPATRQPMTLPRAKSGAADVIAQMGEEVVAVAGLNGDERHPPRVGVQHVAVRQVRPEEPAGGGCHRADTNWIQGLRCTMTLLRPGRRVPPFV